MKHLSATISPWCLLAALAAMLAPRWACADPQASSQAAITLTINRCCDVHCDPGGISHWGRGHHPNGEPNYTGHGDDPEFCGGGEDDRWEPSGGGERRFANGAVGRCWLKTDGNSNFTVKITDPDVNLSQTKDGETFGMRSACWIGWEDESGRVSIAEERANIPPGEQTMWLYATVERLGLMDEFGNYTHTATITIIPGE